MKPPLFFEESRNGEEVWDAGGGVPYVIIH